MKKFVFQVEDWYRKNKRDLPWRKDIDPYHVWISEIMLQQTRIEAVVDYYKKFIDKIPSISVLSCVDDDKLLKLWEGLGYYNRAKNLKKAAIMIMQEYQGVFPDTYCEIIKLPGIGDYTASAIAYICFREKRAAIDGNVLRVYTRYYNDYSDISLLSTKKKVCCEIEKILPENPGEFNQAIMEIGETICIPNGIPLCEECPFKEGCLSFRYQNYMDFPVNGKKSLKKEFDYTVLVFRYQDKIGIHKRSENGLLHGLWEFPNLLSHFDCEKIEKYLKENSYSFSSITPFVSYTHIFSHQKWKMISYLVELKDLPEDSNFYVSIEDVLLHYAIPSCFQPFLLEIKKKYGELLIK